MFVHSKVSVDITLLAPEDADFVKKLRLAFESLNKPEKSVVPSATGWTTAHSKLTQSVEPCILLKSRYDLSTHLIRCLKKDSGAKSRGLADLSHP